MTRSTKSPALPKPSGNPCDLCELGTPRGPDGFHRGEVGIGPTPDKERAALRCRAIMGPPKRHGGSGAYFDPGNSTCWPSPDMGDPAGDLTEVPDFLVNSLANSYATLLTHPCGMEMLRRVRSAWKAIRKAERSGP